MYSHKTRFSIALAISIWIHLLLSLTMFLYQGNNKSNGQTGTLEKKEMLEVEMTSNDDLNKIKRENHDGNEGGKDGENIRRKQAEQFEKDFKVKGEWRELVKKLSQNSNLRQNFPETFDNINTQSNVKESYIFRKRHYEDLVVKEVFPTLLNLEKPFDQIIREAPKSLDKYNERNEIIKNYRKWSNGEIVENRPNVHIVKNSFKSAHHPLEFPKTSREKYFNSTLRESKESQLYNFINRYFEFDPNKGDLPVAVRELYYDNLQRLVYSFSSDPTYLYIDYFDENLNKEDFLKNSLAQVARLKGSKTQTELLFAIQDIYEIQQRAWEIYFNFSNMYKNLSLEQKKKLRYETLRRIQERYQPVLAQKKISNYKDAVRLYSTRREEITDYIIKNTPDHYRKEDAIFEKGRIHWDLGIIQNSDIEKAKAIEIWKSIQYATEVSNNAVFLNRETLEKLKPVFVDYDRLQNVSLVEGHIQNIIQQRQLQRLINKGKREDQILWTK
ncbi:MAG: hypothetical protein OEV78_07950 [Spirochaetia bacterium]|nr:hypothetical protein [Spirochaetia bacterium]